jgi:acyl carrier protein
VNDDTIRAAVLRALASVAPELDPQALQPGLPIREQVDIDSMDFLNFVIEVHRELGVAVPEVDYGQLATIESAVAYLGPRAVRASRDRPPAPGR